MKKIINKIKYWWSRDEIQFKALIAQLEASAEANWKSNFAPRDFKDFETYRASFLQSHLGYLIRDKK